MRRGVSCWRPGRLAPGAVADFYRSSGMPTNRDHLARLAALADANAEEVARLVTDLDATRRLWRPSPERWGVADCLEHLLVTGQLYHPALRALIDAAPRDPARDARRWSPTLVGRLFLRLVGPRGRATPAPSRLRPPQARPDADVRLLAQQGELRRLIADAHGADLRGIRVTSPLSRLLTLRLGEALEMLLAHQQRHLAQAWRVREDARFPVVGRRTGEQPIVRA